MLCFQDYVMASPPKAQAWLLDILAFVQNALPGASTRMYHALPSFFFGKRDVINIGAYKDHFGIHVGYDMVDYLKKKYPGCSYTKSTIQFPYTQPPPLHILEDICGEIRRSAPCV